MSEFKIGQKVYFPGISTKVLTVYENYCDLRGSVVETYPICVNGHSMTTDGKSFVDSELPSIFHATPENRAKLEALYGVKFEEPPVKPTSREIIKAMLDRGDKYVPCWVSDTNEEPNEQNRVELIYKYDEYSKYPYSCEDNSWKYATPFDIRTGLAITELPE